MTQNGLIRNKPYFKGLLGSIAARAFTISLLLLVIPLTIHTFILYKEEYKTALKELVFNLDVLGKSQANLFNQRIDSITRNLNAIHWLTSLPSFSQGITASSKQLLEVGFKEIASQKGSAKFSYFWITSQGKAEAIITSDPSIQDVPRDLSDLAHLDRKVYLYEENVIIDIPVKNGSNLIGVLSACLSKEELFKETLAGFEFPVGFAFLDKEDHVLGGSSNPLIVFNTQDVAAIKAGTYPEFAKKLDDLSMQGDIGMKIPIADNAFCLLAMLPKKDLYAQIGQKFFFKICRLGILFAVFGGFGVILLTRKIAGPLEDLALTMQEVAKGNFSARYSPNKIGFEINELGKQFNQMASSLYANIQEAKKQKLAKELLEQELAIGKSIQQSILPQKMPKIPYLDIASGFIPSKEVSGDFFDVYLRSDNKLILTVADASGKGISACLYSLGLRSMLRSFESSQLSLEEILSKTNDLFSLDTGDSGMFATLWIGILDLASYSLEYASCGHPPALIYEKSGSVHELSSSGSSLGVAPNMKLDIQTTTLKSGSLLLLYTDGMIEAFNAQKQPFGIDGIKNHLQTHPAKSTSSCLTSLIQAIETFTEKTEMADDCTLLCVKIV